MYAVGLGIVPYLALQQSLFLRKIHQASAYLFVSWGSPSHARFAGGGSGAQRASGGSGAALALRESPLGYASLSSRGRKFSLPSNPCNEEEIPGGSCWFVAVSRFRVMGMSFSGLLNGLRVKEVRHVGSFGRCCRF
jgi:hypothetical protein